MTPDQILLWAHIAMVVVFAAWAVTMSFWARALIRAGRMRSPRAWWAACRRGGA